MVSAKQGQSWFAPWRLPCPPAEDEIDAEFERVSGTMRLSCKAVDHGHGLGGCISCQKARLDLAGSLDGCGQALSYLLPNSV
jgi:hypothetical protein